MSNNIYVSASSSGRDRIDPEDSRTKTKATGTPASPQGFKKVMDKEKEEDTTKKMVADADSEEEKVAAEEGAEENAGEQVFSLFARPKVKPQTNVHMKIALREGKEGEEDVPKAGGKVEDESKLPESGLTGYVEAPKKVVKSIYASEYQVDPKKDKTEEDSNDSPAVLFGKMNKDKEATKDVNLAVDDKVRPNAPMKKKESEANPFPEEQLDISRIGLGPAPTASESTFVTSTPDRPAPVTIPKDMQQLIDQIAKELSVVTTGDKTETTIVLTYPPIFDGAKLVVTGFETAKGELNITLANLTQNAQQVVQQQQHNLLASLEAKGYNVHIFNATTADIQPIVIAEAQVSKDRGQKEEGGQGQGHHKDEEQA